MPVVTVQTKDGPFTAFVCVRPKPKLCTFCHNKWICKYCDFATGKGKTCDAGMCEKCATSVGPDLDYCPRHKDQPPPPQGSLFGDDNEAG